jgi:hypothetical protein
MDREGSHQAALMPRPNNEAPRITVAGTPLGEDVENVHAAGSKVRIASSVFSRKAA